MSETAKALTHEQVSAWVRVGFEEGLREGRQAQGVAVDARPPAWPGPNEQGLATTMVWGAVLRCADELANGGLAGQFYFCSTWHPRPPEQKAAREKLIARHWKPSRRKHEEKEVLVDFLVMQHDEGASEEARSRVLLAVESELHSKHGVQPQFVDGYARDFFKLLAIQADIRLFFARVGSVRGASQAERLADLKESLGALCDRFKDRLKNVRLACVLLPADWPDGHAVSIGIWNGEKLDWQPALLPAEPT